MYLLIVYIPESHVEVVKQALFQAGAGVIDAYGQCAWQVLGQGQFCPQAGSDPFLGHQGVLETVAEYRVEMVCAQIYIADVIAALRRAHPYEVPAFSVIKTENIEG